MADWQPKLYLRFEKERTQPSVDLAARIPRENPNRIIDIGCGPGNSTRVLRARFPNAEIIGLDSSPAMIEEAKGQRDDLRWVCADTSDDLTSLGKFDIVFSNAAIQWMPRQEVLLLRLWAMLNEGGVLAVQVPYTEHMPIRTELNKLAESPEWQDFFANKQSDHGIHAASFYYHALCAVTESIALWQTDYYHVMRTHGDIVDWYKGAGLRPYLDCLGQDARKAAFLAAYETSLRDAYPVQRNGKVLFPFTRIFFVAEKV